MVRKILLTMILGMSYRYTLSWLKYYMWLSNKYYIHKFIFIFLTDSQLETVLWTTLYANKTTTVYELLQVQTTAEAL